MSSVETLAALVASDTLETPLVIGVLGDWGSGKTSVMHLLKARLPKGSTRVWFDAWQYGSQGKALWRALLLVVVEALRERVESAGKEQEIEKLTTSLYRSAEYEESGDLRVNWKAVVPLAMQAALGFVPGAKETLKSLFGWLQKDGNVEELMTLVERERTTSFRDRVTSLEQFRNALQDLVKTYVTGDYKNPPQENRLYVFVDDLDRCLPEAAVGTLEAIKVFLDIPGCVFILGMDRAVVEQGVRHRYRDFATKEGDPGVDPGKYLDKIIQIPFSLPPLADGQIEGYVKHWCKENAEESIRRAIEPVVTKGVAANPRSVKRTLNVVRLMAELRRQARGSLVDNELPLLTKLVVLQTSYRESYRLIVDDPSRLTALEVDAAKDKSEQKVLRENPRMRQMLRLEPKFMSLDRIELEDLIFLTRVSAQE
jgi:hypothetical protein